ncbi:type I glyceraldehyde-3-phosphate dehydrogenase [Denitromonas halophila]|uniref:Glyceraldehyde-3-phosphate dehydrogenase n=1 Tax=Denitromonas halophila TaxID=1629404 RepID=A0A557R2A4_9RHOO|nr:type I glyceraldehyde-3-phosphate dehydrogenase [Denitromonas halophila]TVO59289.1 type I glyceraldehyde-3-phosphate dehydrogenase [Denitromonas halophila]
MSIRIAINGYGRIGRNVLRAFYEGGKRHPVEIVAINDLGNAETNAHLTRHDSVHGRFGHAVAVADGHLLVDDDMIHVSAERDPAKLPWRELGVDVVLECTGLFTSKASAGAHLAAGAGKVLISAPGAADVDATIVYGVNHHTLRADHQVVSNASCTTNCLAPLAWALHGPLGIERGLMTTVHSYTNDQVLTDVYHTDLRRARSATQSLIPTKTGAAAAVGLVIPELAGRLDGFAIRVPTPNVSFTDFTFIARRPTSVTEVNDLVREAAHGRLARILAINDAPLVSCDFNHDAHSAIFDTTLTRVDENLVKVTAWYDNEWGFSNRMLDTTVAMMEAAQ